ncbi:UNVERIFIED_CONTAM: hypothetical protein GTU68_066883, partial [Idotea baltica]|nr:hypothetical protein [Idotea baltica]
CVHANDASVLLKVPGVGKKTAERLLIELKDRLKQWTVETVDINHDSDDCFVQASGVHAESDAINALVSLGYKPQEATKAVTLIKEKGLAREELVRRALQSMH